MLNYPLQKYIYHMRLITLKVLATEIFMSLALIAYLVYLRALMLTYGPLLINVIVI